MPPASRSVAAAPSGQGTPRTLARRAGKPVVDLARSLKDLLELVEDLKARGVQLHFHKEGLLFTSEKNHTQDLMLSMMGAVAQFERSMIRERQAEGIAKAKAAGVYKGRKKSVDEEAIRAAIAGGLSFRKAAEVLKVSLSSVQRAMRPKEGG